MIPVKTYFKPNIILTLTLGLPRCWDLSLTWNSRGEMAQSIKTLLKEIRRTNSIRNCPHTPIPDLWKWTAPTVRCTHILAEIICIFSDRTNFIYTNDLHGFFLLQIFWFRQKKDWWTKQYLKQVASKMFWFFIEGIGPFAEQSVAHQKD